MEIRLDVSKLQMSTVANIARETDDVKALEQLACVENTLVAKSVINNPVTTKKIREDIYKLWKNRKDKSWVVQTLATNPLNNDTIRSMLDAEWSAGRIVRVGLAMQQDISEENLNRLYEKVMAGDVDLFCKKSVLYTMSHRNDLSGEMKNKLMVSIANL